MVRLKVVRFQVSFVPVCYFNSKMVRLKDHEVSEEFFRNGHFNSKMVRLKGLNQAQIDNIYQFQFQDGTIKRTGEVIFALG